MKCPSCNNEELRSKLAQRLGDFKWKIRHFEYLVEQMEVMVEDYFVPDEDD